MNDKHGLIFGSFVLLILVPEGYSLKCYQCNSHTNSTCGDEKVPEVFAADCPRDGKTYILCRKIKQVIDFEVNGLPPDSRIIRSCGWDDKAHSDKCFQRSGFGGRQEVCSCKDENCNSSPNVYFSKMLLILVAIATFQLTL